MFSWRAVRSYGRVTVAEGDFFDPPSGAGYESIREPADRGHPARASQLTGGGRSMHDKCMAVKTITIDLEAYEALSRHKRKGDSFSRVIKEHFGRRRTGRDLGALIASLRLSEDTLESAEELVRRRGRSRARAPKL
jgi:predicted CopG family antitoxin